MNTHDYDLIMSVYQPCAKVVKPIFNENFRVN